MVITFGEIMLRLKSPGKTRLFQTPSLEATFGGGEFNVASALVSLGFPARFVTALPPGPLGEGALGWIRSQGVGTGSIIRTPGRLGVYYLEEGAAQRPSTVTYDREGSSLATAGPQAWDWEGAFQGGSWFHVTGITPGVSQKAAESALDALKAAGKRGLTRSLDLNYRKKLWNWGPAPQEVMPPLVNQCEILMANEEDLQKSLGLPELPLASPQALVDYSAGIQRRFPGVIMVTVTLRTSFGADKNRWEALVLLPQEGQVFRSRSYDLDPIVDRVGGGDAFAAGFIAGLLEGKPPKEALEWGTALGCLKHTVPGDQPRISRSELEALVSGEASGRVQR